MDDRVKKIENSIKARFDQNDIKLDRELKKVRDNISKAAEMTKNEINKVEMVGITA